MRLPANAPVLFFCVLIFDYLLSFLDHTDRVSCPFPPISFFITLTTYQNVSIWCFGDSHDILGKSGTRTGGGRPKSLRHWRSLFARLPGFIDKSIRNAAYYRLLVKFRLSWLSFFSGKAVLAFSAKVPGIVQETVALMAIFTEEFAAFSFHFAATDGAAVFQSVCTHFQYQDSFCPGFVLKLGSDLTA